MAKLLYRKYQNKNRKSNAYGKTFARMVSTGTLDTNEICAHIAKHGTIYTSDIVKGVVEKFINCFEELLLEGYKLKLDGLGTFYLSINTEGTETEEEFIPNANIKKVRVVFLGDQAKRSEYATKVMTRKAQWRDVNDLVETESSGSGSSNGDGTTIENP
ncbi:MAG: hypothetical protein IJQ76_03680 [Prevotella sp.]|nr:hypothetical protein [Prevotella sp.]